MTQTAYAIDFTDTEWEEIESLCRGVFEIGNSDTTLSRRQWIAIAYMATGKATDIRIGSYNMEDGYDDGNAAWAEELDKISKDILSIFKPGDGQI